MFSHKNSKRGAKFLSYYGCIFPESFDKGNAFTYTVCHFHHHRKPHTLEHHRIMIACTAHDPGNGNIPYFPQFLGNSQSRLQRTFSQCCKSNVRGRKKDGNQPWRYCRRLWCRMMGCLELKQTLQRVEVKLVPEMQWPQGRQMLFPGQTKIQPGQDRCCSPRWLFPVRNRYRKQQLAHLHRPLLLLARINAVFICQGINTADLFQLSDIIVLLKTDSIKCLSFTYYIYFVRWCGISR